MTWSLVVVIAIGIGAAFVLPPLLKDPCSNPIVEVLPSPEGSHKAVIFVRNCGATTDFSTQMSVLRADNGTPKGAGNTFVADSNHGKAPTWHWGGPWIQVKWQNAGHPIVAYAPGSRIYQRQDSVLGVTVSYVEEGTAANH